MIYCNNLKLSFRDKLIFENLNIRIERGENVCIGGISGKGKSSILKLLQGYLLPDNGIIEINGKILDKSTVKQIRESITYIPQNINFSINNALELIELMDIHKNLPLIEDFMRKLGLDPNIIKQNFNEISGGQKQRIIIAICLSIDNEIILMDEPTSSLDEVSIKHLIEIIRLLKGKTIVSTSHNASWLKSVEKIIDL